MPTLKYWNGLEWVETNIGNAESVGGYLPSDFVLKTELDLLNENLHELSYYKTNKDVDGIFTTTEYQRKDGTTYATSVLSEKDTNGNYTKDTCTYYDNVGTVIKTVTWSITYDTAGDIVSKVIL